MQARSVIHQCAHARQTENQRPHFRTNGQRLPGRSCIPKTRQLFGKIPDTLLAIRYPVWAHFHEQVFQAIAISLGTDENGGFAGDAHELPLTDCRLSWTMARDTPGASTA